jgi:hypothetical protein
MALMYVTDKIYLEVRRSRSCLKLGGMRLEVMIKTSTEIRTLIYSWILTPFFIDSLFYLESPTTETLSGCVGVLNNQDSFVDSSCSSVGDARHGCGIDSVWAVYC